MSEPTTPTPEAAPEPAPEPSVDWRHEAAVAFKARDDARTRLSSLEQELASARAELDLLRGQAAEVQKQSRHSAFVDAVRNKLIANGADPSPKAISAVLRAVEDFDVFPEQPDEQHIAAAIQHLTSIAPQLVVTHRPSSVPPTPGRSRAPAPSPRRF